eukprot:COSAG02_NODE_1448_length_12570_cov_711.058295_7_plen_65_part_00
MAPNVPQGTCVGTCDGRTCVEASGATILIQQDSSGAEPVTIGIVSSCQEGFAKVRAPDLAVPEL